MDAVVLNDLTAIVAEVELGLPDKAALTTLLAAITRPIEVEVISATIEPRIKLRRENDLPAQLRNSFFALLIFSYIPHS